MKTRFFSFQPILTPNQLTLAAATYIALVLNIPFYIHVLSAVRENSDFNGLFLLSVPLVLMGLTTVFYAVFSVRWVFKPVIIFTVLLSTLMCYATHYYGIIFDRGMLQNGLETDTAEAFSYVNLNAIAFMLVVGLLPSMWIARTKLICKPVVSELFARFRLIATASTITFVLAAIFYVNYASVGRNHRELTAYLIPFKLYEASFKYVRDQIQEPEDAEHFTLLDPSPSLNSSNNKKLTILIVGETARAQNFSLNGYAKDTNRFTQAQQVVSFDHASSCGTATALSLPCMFSRLDREHYDKHQARTQQNVLDIAQAAGIDIEWIDNNNGGCKGVCDRVNATFIRPDTPSPLCDGEYCLDEILLQELDNRLGSVDDKHLIALHLMGSHGPTYYRRYPADHKRFTPDCPRSDIQNCDQASLINTYDNTIAYTDYVISEVIKRLDTFTVQTGIETSLLYVSDHGESLGENGMYLHGFPYAFAPKEQTSVPMLFWSNADQFDRTCVKQQIHKNISHDDLFDTLLGMLGVQTKVYDAHHDIFATCSTQPALT
ncbi:phosphoethanolamine transferase [Alteromonas facilis]|uniref:phosphoethanolamine transferase n=1 Tax=Alteromonas facilis TaxID=2048004 RepID=UPI000C28A844|nr:phosphoethanolamine--lipid A transferase [Alteromonas facilis]